MVVVAVVMTTALAIGRDHILSLLSLYYQPASQPGAGPTSMMADGDSASDRGDDGSRYRP